MPSNSTLPCSGCVLYFNNKLSPQRGMKQGADVEPLYLKDTLGQVDETVSQVNQLAQVLSITNTHNCKTPSWTILTNNPEFLTMNQEDDIQNSKKADHLELRSPKRTSVTPIPGQGKLRLPNDSSPLADVVGATLLKPHGDSDNITLNMSSACKVEGILPGGTRCQILLDTGATTTVINAQFAQNNPYLRRLQPLRDHLTMTVRVASGEILQADSWLLFTITIQKHVFQLLAIVMPIDPHIDLIIGVKTLIELEARVNLASLSLQIPDTRIQCRVVNIKTPCDPDPVLVSLEAAQPITGRVVFRYPRPLDGHWQASLLTFRSGKSTLRLTPAQTPAGLKPGTYFGNIDSRSTDTYERSLAMLWRLGQGRSILNPGVQRSPITLASLADVLKPNHKPGTGKTTDPYPWLSADDKRRHMTDEEILRSVISLDEAALDSKGKEEFMRMLLKHKAAFSLRDEIGECPRLRIHLQLHDTTPFYKRPFPIKPGEKEIIDKEMDRLVALGVLEKGLSGYSSPIMLVPRKGSSIPRVVTDFRHLNTKLVRLNVAFPLVRDTLQVLGDSGCEVISVIDLRDAYHTLRLDEDSKQYCGIIPYYGSDSYLYQRLGMGLSVSPAIWQTFINFILQNIPEKDYHIAIMDDCMTYSKAQDHSRHIAALLSSLITHGLKISPRKCQFFRTQICYMGSTISITPQGVTFEILRSRVEAIQKLKAPTNASECRMLCGMVNYVAQFVPHLKDLLIPVYELTKKHRPFIWTAVTQQAFEAIQEQLASPPVLYMPNAVGRFQLYSDTSHYATGAALYQIQDGLPRLIGYASKKLLPAVKNYTITELELFGLKLNIEAFQHLLSRVEFDAVVDHSALVYIVKAHKEPATHRLKKFLEELRRFSFRLHYIKGKDMVPGDFLSRYPRDGDPCDPNEPIICAITRSMTKQDAGQTKTIQPGPEIQTSEAAQTTTISPHTEIDRSLAPSSTLRVGPPGIDTNQQCVHPNPQYLYNKPLKFPIPQDIAEQLKRLPRQSELEPTIQKLQGKYLINTHLTLREHDLKNAYLQCSRFQDIYRYLADNIMPGPKARRQAVLRMLDCYTLIDGFMYHVYKMAADDPRIRLVIPESLSYLVFHIYHNSLLGGHQGISRTYYTIKRYYHIPNLFANLRGYVQSCHECQMSEPAQQPHRKLIIRIPKHYRPMTYLSCDIKYMPKTEDGFKYLFVVTCDITGFVLVCPLREITGPHLSEALLQTVVWIFGPPETLIIDEERALSGRVMKAVYDTLGIDIKTISPFNHGSLKTERYIQTVANSLIKYLSGTGEKWVYLVKLICYALNSFISPSVGYSPYELVFGREPKPLVYESKPFQKQMVTYKEYHETLLERFKFHEDIVRLRAQQRQERENIGRPSSGFARGQLVYLLSPRTSLLQTSQKKFTLDYVGPLVIHAVINPYQYELIDLEGERLKGLFHFNRLKPAFLRIFPKGVATTIQELREAWTKLGWEEYPKEPDMTKPPNTAKDTLSIMLEATKEYLPGGKDMTYKQDPDLTHLQMHLLERLQ